MHSILLLRVKRENAGAVCAWVWVQSRHGRGMWGARGDQNNVGSIIAPFSGLLEQLN